MTRTDTAVLTGPLPDGRQVVVTEFGETPAEAIETFIELRPQPAPDPAGLGPQEVLLRIRSAAVSWVDLLMTSGQYQHMPAPPYTPGMECAGEVLATGSEVAAAHCRPGARVLVDTMKVGPRSSGAYRGVGGLASYAVVPADAVLPIPGDLSFDQAAMLLQAYETAYHCLVARGNLQPGETILINGATGLTGLAAVEMARMLGATVIAIGRSAEKLARVKEVGADHVVSVLDETGALRRFRDDVKALTGGRGVDVVYDAVGGEISLECLRCTDFGARFLIVGWTSTPDVARGKGQRGAPRANVLPTNIIQMKGLSVLGCPSAIAVAKDPSIRPERLASILCWAEEGRIRPYVSHVFAMEDVREALRARWIGQVTGGCVVHP
ncbi:NADPH:quinone oxidoreductase family protein [Antarcticimicrobium luteum]|uniref:NADPH:quinone oxidoreductase family protein n=1 Tax=Antarcticimicrobium luteum TaxID=2547397 RepID=A0A4R5V7U8_9RHOB|nr:NADPH:quinone oxidoreductase family protein [Antarcticimicrobium luteum]TDK48132.1 NADPH:quinone oxidoreductase family protein [Antarcticimicrobium luteum]